MVGMFQDITKWLRSKALPANTRPAHYYVHPSETIFYKQFRHDVTAADAPIAGTGEFIIAQFTVLKSQVVVVKGFAPYAMERTDVSDPVVGLESARYILPENGNDWFAFTPRVSDGTGMLIETNLNAPQNMNAAGKSDGQRQRLNGITQITLSPYTDALRSMHGLFFNIFVDSGQTFQVIFSLAGPPASVGAISNPFVIGTPVAPGTKRVDFAGVVLMGVQLPATYYREVAGMFGENDPG